MVETKIFVFIKAQEKKELLRQEGEMKFIAS